MRCALSVMDIPSPSAQRTDAEPADVGVQTLRPVPELLRGLGVRFEDIARRVGLSASILDDARNRIGCAELGRLLDACASATACPHFAVLVGACADIGDIGAIGPLARHASSVRHALNVFVTHLHLHDRGAALAMSERGDIQVELAYLMFNPDLPGGRHIAEGTLAVAMRVLRTLCGPNWTPIEVTLARVEPADKAAYRRYFGTAVRFEAARYAIVFHSHWLDRPIPSADAKERARIGRLVDELERSRSASMTERTREALTRMLISTCPSVVSVAQVLNVSPRTLNRRLASEGTTFKALLEEARHALARQLLRETHLSATEISAVLHYTTPSAFSRAFKHWEDGLGPRRMRAAGARSGAGEFAI